MKGIIAIALLGVIASANALADPIDFHPSAQTDGFSYSYQIGSASNYSNATEYGVGIATLNEMVGFSFDIQSLGNSNGDWFNDLDETFAFEQIETVPTPGALALFALGGFLLAFRLAWKKKRG